MMNLIGHQKWKWEKLLDLKEPQAVVYYLTGFVSFFLNPTSLYSLVVQNGRQ